MGQSEYGKLPEVGRPQGAAWRMLQNEGIVWEGQVVIPAERQELAARLIVTQQRIVFIRENGVTLELDRSWLRSAPTMPSSGSVRLVIATSGEADAGVEALVVQPRDGRIAASRLVAALTGGPRPALPLPPRPHSVLEGQIRNAPPGSVNAPAAAYPTPKTDATRTQTRQTPTGQFAPGGPWGHTADVSSRPASPSGPAQHAEPAPPAKGPVFGTRVPPQPTPQAQPTPSFGVRPASASSASPAEPAHQPSPQPTESPQERPQTTPGASSPFTWRETARQSEAAATPRRRSSPGGDPLERLAERFGVPTSTTGRLGPTSGRDPLDDVRPRTGSDQTRMLPGLPPSGPVLNPRHTGKDRSTSLRDLSSRAEPRTAREWPALPSEEDVPSYGRPFTTLRETRLSGVPLTTRPGPVPTSDSRSATGGRGGSGNGSGIGGGSTEGSSRGDWLRRRSVLWGTTVGILLVLTAALGLYLVLGGTDDDHNGNSDDDFAVTSDDAALSVGTPATESAAKAPTATIPRGIGGESALSAPPALASETGATAAPVGTEPASAGQDAAVSVTAASDQPTLEPTETPRPTATQAPTNTPEPEIPTQPASVTEDVPPAQVAVVGPFRYTIEAVSVGDSLPELSQDSSPYGGDWLALIVYASNWSDGEAILDMTQFTADVATETSYQNYKLDGWSNVVAERLGITPVLGATDQATLQPGEGVRIGLLFLVSDNPVSTVLRIGQTPVDLEAAFNSSKSMLDLGDPPDSAVDLVEATVTDVLDGQTIEVEIDGLTTTVRYLGTQAPTGNACYADEATTANEELVAGETVWLEREYADDDPSGAWLRDVWVMGDAGSLVLVTGPLVSEGYLEATVERPDSRFAAYLETAEMVARDEGRGLWGACGAADASADGAMTSADVTTPADTLTDEVPTIAPIAGRQTAA